MVLPVSGAISASMINTELFRSANAQFSIGGTLERELAGKPSGPISFSDFYGKSWVTPGSAGWWSPGSYTFTVPRYNLITIYLYGGGGNGAGAYSNGVNGNYSVFYGPITLVAYGGNGGTGYSGGAGGTVYNGSSGSANGSNGGYGTHVGDTTPGYTAYSGAGGNSGSGHAGGAAKSFTSGGSVGNYYGNSSGFSGGGSGGGRIWTESSGDPKNPNYVYRAEGFGGGGGGAYLIRSFYRGDYGAPTVGGSYSLIVANQAAGGYGGTGGPGGVYISWS